MADRPDHDLADRLSIEHQHPSPSGKIGLCQCPRCPDLRAAAARLRQLTDRRTQLTGDTSVDIAITYGYEVGVEDGRAEVLAERDELRRQLDTLLDAIGDSGDLEWLASACLDEALACQQVGGFGETVGVLSQAAVALQRLAAAVGDPEEGR